MKVRGQNANRSTVIQMAENDQKVRGGTSQTIFSLPFDRLPVQTVTSDIHHPIVRGGGGGIYLIRAFDLECSFSLTCVENVHVSRW